MSVSTERHSATDLQQLIERAATFEAEGNFDEAIACYEEALLAGAATDEVCYSLALLYKQQLLYEDALALFERCLDSPEYGVSAHYASGECQLALGQLAAAATHFDAAVTQIALDDVTDDQVEEVSQIYRVAIDTFTSLDQHDRADRLSTALNTFLASLSSHGHAPSATGPLSARLYALQPSEGNDAPRTGGLAPSAGPLRSTGNERLAGSLDMSSQLAGTGRLRSVYRRLTGPLEVAAPDTSELKKRREQTSAQNGATAGTPTAEPQRHNPTATRRPVRVVPTIPLVDETTQPLEVRALLSRSAEDARHGRCDAVIDDCHHVIVLAPDYLPVHLRLAEAFAGAGLLAEAVEKCRFLIQVYEARREPLATLPIYRLLGALNSHDLTPWITMADLYFTRGGDPAIRADIRALSERAASLGREAVALAYAERLVSSDSGDRESRLLAASLYLRTGDTDRALKQYQALLRLDRTDAVATAGANIALTLNEGDLHWPSLERLVALLRAANDTTRRAVIMLYKQVIPNATRAVTDLHVATGIILLALGDAAEIVLLDLHDATTALQHLLEGLRCAGTRTSPAVRFALAYGLKQAYAALGDGTVERQWLQRAAELLSDRRVIEFATKTRLFGAPIAVGALHIALAESLVWAGKIDHAVSVLESAKADVPDDVAMRQWLTALYHQQGRLGQALDELDALAERLAETGRLNEMADTLRQMSTLGGDNLLAKTRVADRLLKRGFPEEALRELEGIADIYQRAGQIAEAARALRRAADTAWMIGQRNYAYELYSRILTLAPDDIGPRQAYINCLLQGGRQAEAAAQQRAIAETFREQQQVQETIAALHQVIALDPQDVEAYTWLGEALSSVGEHAQAEQVYRRLAHLTPQDPLDQAQQAAAPYPRSVPAGPASPATGSRPTGRDSQAGEGAADLGQQRHSA